MQSFNEEQDDRKRVDSCKQREGRALANAFDDGLKTSQRSRGQETSHQVAHCLNGRRILRIEVY